MVADTPLFVHGAARRCQFGPAGGFLLLTFSEVSLFAFRRLTNSFPRTHGNNPREREVWGQHAAAPTPLLPPSSGDAQDKNTKPVFTPNHVPRSSRGRRKPSVRGDFTSWLLSEQHAGTARLQIASRTRVHLQYPTASSPVPPARHAPSSATPHGVQQALAKVTKQPCAFKALFLTSP